MLFGVLKFGVIIKLCWYRFFDVYLGCKFWEDWWEFLWSCNGDEDGGDVGVSGRSFLCGRWSGEFVIWIERDFFFVVF